MSASREICLSEIADLNPPFPRNVSDNEIVSFVSMGQLSAESASTDSGKDRQYLEVKKGYTPFARGDLLVAKITPCFENSKIGAANIERDVGVGSTEFHVIRPRPERVDGRYLLHFLRQQRIIDAGERRMTGSAGQRRVPESFLAHLTVPDVSVTEQQRIAAILDQVGALRTKRKDAIVRLRELDRAIFLTMFGDPLSNPKTLPTRPIAEIGAVVTGNTPSRARPEYYGDAIEWLKSDNLNSPEYFATLAEEFLSKEGRDVARVVPPLSILVTCIAGSPDCIGNAAIVDRYVAFNQQINALVPKIGDAHFFYAQLRFGKGLIQAASTNAMKGMVNKSRFENINLLFPPVDQQQNYGRISLKIESLRAKHNAHLRQLERLSKSLEDYAFRGRL